MNARLTIACFFSIISFFFIPPSIVMAALPSQVEGRDVITGKVQKIILFGARKPDPASDVKQGAPYKGTVAVFLSAKCPCSASHEVALRNLHKEFSSRGFQFMGFHSNKDESPDVAQRHFAQTALPFLVVEDRGQNLANELKALKTPHVFVISGSGSILYQGGVDDSKNHGQAKHHYLRDALVAISEGRSVAISEARTLGCVIKR